MSMTASCITQQTSSLHVTAAIEEAAVSEGGRILNDHYDLEDYVKRRAHFLGTRRDYRHCRFDLFPSVQCDAEVIFLSISEQLSVQEIRRREIQHEVFPLLPMPTTANTSTLNEFLDYPPTEWSPSLMWSAPSTTGHSNDSEGSDTTVFSPFADKVKSAVTAFNPRFHPFKKSTQSEAETEAALRAAVLNASQFYSNPSQLPPRQFPAGYTMQHITALPRAPTNMFSAEWSKNTTAEVANTTYPAQQTIHNKLSSSPEVVAESIELRSSTNTTMSLPPSTRASSVHPQDLFEDRRHSGGRSVQAPSTGQGVHSKGIATPGSDIDYPAIDQNSLVDDNSVRAETTSKNSAVVIVGQDVFALSGRGMHVPVKTKRGVKRAASPEYDSDTPEDEFPGVVQADEASPPPKKNFKLFGPRKSDRPTVEIDRVDSPLAEQKSSSTKGLKSSSSIEKPKNATQNKIKEASTKKPTPNTLEAVIAGTVLPKSSQEAIDAAEIRYQRLLAERNKANPSSSKTSRAKKARKVNEKPDIMPEFFWLENFLKGHEHNTVRCICGAVEDGIGKYTACDSCGVWQHDVCIGEAIPKDADNEDYYCYVCDPWLHRKLIAEVRRAHPLV